MKHKLLAGLDIAVESICYTLLTYLLLSALFSMKHSLLYIPLMALYTVITGQYLRGLEKHIPRAAAGGLLRGRAGSCRDSGVSADGIRAFCGIGKEGEACWNC